MMDTKLYVQGQESDFLNYISDKKYSKIVLIADARTNGFCIPVLKKMIPDFKFLRTIVVPAGEENKTLDTCSYLWSQFQIHAVDKKSLLISVGGGMLSDLVGLAASLYKRGIEVANIPTTLLSMVDASHGGKTAIDFEGTKNLIGSFHLPTAVYINPIFLESLSERIMVSGCAEMIKHALIHSESLWNQVKTFSVQDLIQLDSIQTSIEVKTKLAAQDPKDEGIRQALNFGHSLGHAIESSHMSEKNPLLHGEAIMIGMLLELQLSATKLGMPLHILNDFVLIKERLFPELKPILNGNDILHYLKQDKKNDTEVRVSLLHQVGSPALQVAVSHDEIITIISNYDPL